jgi:hypothetical protein
MTTKECPDGKILNPASNRCVDINGAIGKKLVKAVNTPLKTNQVDIPVVPKKRGRPKKIIVDNPLNTNVPQASVVLTPLKRGPKKKDIKIESNDNGNDNDYTKYNNDIKRQLTPLIEPSYFYNIEDEIKIIENSNHSSSTKLSYYKKIYIDLTDLKQYFDEKVLEASTKTKPKYKLFITYNNDRINRINKYYQPLIKKVNTIEKKHKIAPKSDIMIIEPIFSKEELTNTKIDNAKNVINNAIIARKARNTMDKKRKENVVSKSSVDTHKELLDIIYDIAIIVNNKANIPKNTIMDVRSNYKKFKDFKNYNKKDMMAFIDKYKQYI